MRFARRLVGLCLLVFLGGSCDTTQPLQVQEQSVQLSFKAVNAQLKTFNVWDVFEDNNGDELPDDGLRHFWCETVPASQNVNPTTIPWHYSLQIKVLRAGQTVSETITRPAALNLSCPPVPAGTPPKCNTTAYETGPGLTQIAVPPKADICTLNANRTACPLGSAPPPGGSRFRFRNVRRQSGATLILMTSTASPLFVQIRDDVPGMPLGLGQGLCSAGNPGPVNIDGKPQPFTIAINKGDTVVVKARLSTLAPQGGGISSLLQGGGSPPTALSATMTLEGRPINLVGNPSGRGVSFSYTSR